MRTRMPSIRLLISICVPLCLLPLQAASPNVWHSATGGGGVEYRWRAGFLGACHIEFRDSATVGASRNTEISGDIIYDRTTLEGIERNALHSFTLTIYGFGSTVGPDVGCQQINDITIRELKRFFPPLMV
jgi:hypothetical protein